MLVVMVRIPVGSDEEGERLAERFRNRAGLVDGAPGFLGFELLKGEGEYISVSRWATREALDSWMHSQANREAHSRSQAPTRAGHPQAGVPSGEQMAQGERPSGPPASSTLIYEVIIPEQRNG